jgi:7-carboxy-7-deazaguanine synthase
MLELTECFYSLQGEGPFAGRPAVFVRLSRCVPPLCPWCDTAYAWEPGTPVAVDDLVERIMAYPCRFLVITGGEPFLQWSSGLQALETALLQRDCQVQVETSGKIEIPLASQGVTVCSPKFLEERWHFIGANCAAVDAFKFVVEDDFAAVDAFIERWKIPADKVWIMPRGATRAAQLAHIETIWQYCVARGYRFSPRLHTLAFNNLQGV